ncbi:MAG: aldo/keto reductase [Alteromonas sp.]|uniref:aldo/keto reductase n=1 Tax=Alteromonas australica TaxID=589873 RepID=UPI000C364B4F|nr:aldo/keto reductase [Alteromonas australica]MAO28756.1 aldo/keto reductase [Alteromonas sp.]HBF70269.1 aldo/keto reductase [Alteromonas australica]|tara:strand:+ start:277 stop:1227 length:951 start_codon:yes stop_codon:yes gene_type:complete
MQTYFPEASRLIYGCMGLGGGWNDIAATNDDVKQAQSVIEKALELNITVFDHADIYTFGKAETVFGNVLRDSPALKEQMVLQSKCAIRFEDDMGPKRYDFSAKWISSSVEGILSRLHIEQLDILLLHRPDPLMELEEVAQTLALLQQQGKIKHVGVSNMHSHQMAYLQSALSTPIVANQLEMSLAFRDWLEDGVTTNSPANRHSGYAPGTLEYCMMNNVQLQAWGSLAQGKYTGAATQNEMEAATAALVNQLAAEYTTSPEAIVLAWLMRHPANIQPVLGTTNLSRLTACEQANRTHLSREHWYKLWETARGTEMP